METSLAKKLALIQLNIKASKDRYNSFGKYSYRSAEDIVNSVKKCVKELNINDVYLKMTDDLIIIGDRYYIKSTVSVNDEKGCIQSVGIARESEDKKGMDSAQITGSASSYARKYALNGLLALDDNEDIDSMNNSDVVIKSPDRKKIINRIREELKNKPTDYVQIVEKYISDPNLSIEKLNDSLKRVKEFVPGK